MRCPKCGFEPQAIEIYQLEDPSFLERGRWASDPEHKKTLEFYFWFLKGLSSARLLDLGSGPGTVSIPLSRLGNVGEIVCFDIDESARSHLSKVKAENHLANLTVSGEMGQAHALPFEDDSFDGIICRYSMHHFPDQPGSMREMARCIKPNGVLIYSDPAMPSHSRDETDPLYRMREASFGGYRTYHEMVNLVADNRFEIQAIRPYDYQRGTMDDFLKYQDEPLKSELIERWLGVDSRTKRELKWTGSREGPFITYPIIDIAATFSG